MNPDYKRFFSPGQSQQQFWDPSQPAIERTPGQNQIQQLVAILTQLAELYQLQGRYREAELLLVQALNIAYSKNAKFLDFEEISDLLREFSAKEGEFQKIDDFDIKSKELQSHLRTPKSERLRKSSLKRVRGLLKTQESAVNRKESSLARVRGLLKTEGSPLTDDEVQKARLDYLSGKYL